MTEGTVARVPDQRRKIEQLGMPVCDPLDSRPLPQKSRPPGFQMQSGHWGRPWRLREFCVNQWRWWCSVIEQLHGIPVRWLVTPFDLDKNISAPNSPERASALRTRRPGLRNSPSAQISQISHFRTLQLNCGSVCIWRIPARTIHFEAQICERRVPKKPRTRIFRLPISDSESTIGAPWAGENPCNATETAPGILAKNCRIHQHTCPGHPQDDKRRCRALAARCVAGAQ